MPRWLVRAGLWCACGSTRRPLPRPIGSVHYSDKFGVAHRAAAAPLRNRTNVRRLALFKMPYGGRTVVEHKDLMVAILGAAAGLAGLVLVFLGVVIAARASYAPGTPDRVLKRLRIAAWSVVLVFGLSLAAVALPLSWMVWTSTDGVMWAAVGVFAAQLGALAALATFVTSQAMKG